MLRDVFYFGEKPNVHPRERHAENIDDARAKCTTSHFWIINEFCDYTNFDWDFDFDFLPDEDVWAEDHNNIWPSIHQKDSGTWLSPKEISDIRVYRQDVNPLNRKKEPSTLWKFLDNVDKTKFDFSWHPDPSDPPYIYKWGGKFFPVELASVLEYHTPGNNGIVKYMKQIVDLVPNHDLITIHQPINTDKWDLSWRPDPLEPPYIYVWGNKWIPAELEPTLTYHVPGATEIKYMKDQISVLPQEERWVKHNEVVNFDFSWRPDPREPAYNYVWGNKYEPAEIKPTLEYRMPDATETKYMKDTVEVAPQWDRWEFVEDVIKDQFDFSWRPDPLEPPFIYVFGNHLYEGAVMPTLRYTVPGATEIKYVNEVKPKLASKPELFEHLEDSYGIDYSWRPDPTSPPYIYAWGNQWNKPEDKVSIQFIVEGATEYKYMDERSTRKPCMENWVTPDNIDQESFDYSWEPNPKEPAMIHEFATQWQKTGGPCYIVEGATSRKYEDVIKAKALPNKTNWKIPQNMLVDSFDFSWHPDATSPLYIYHFATQWALSGGPIYITPGAEEVKYIDDQTATALPCKDNWEYDPKLIDESEFDFSWHPYVEDQPYVYQFGTQWQKTGGPKYMTPGVHKGSPVKYIDTRILKAKRLPNPKAFKTLDAIVKDFDYSWHPDETEDPFIYQFGNNLYPAEIMPTIEYRVIGADQVKYVHDIVATLGENKDNWEIPNNIDDTGFDYSWVPNPKDPPYIYEFATQWQKTGGPRYVVAEATEVNYVDHQTVKRLPSKDNWKTVNDIDEESFDWSWHPDATSPPYVYHFATQWALSGGPIYMTPGADEVKYIEDQIAKALSCRDNWEFDSSLIDENEFDFSWHPYVEDQPYIYQFGTQWQKTGGPRYMTPGVHEGSPTKYIDTRILKAKRLPNPNAKEWGVLNNYKIKDFDWSWHHDETEEPFIYQFGSNLYPAEEMPTIEYKVAKSDQVKYVHAIVATLGENKDGWEIPNNIDDSAFDYSWVPNPKDPPYIYEFATQWQKTGGPRYVVLGATEVNYVDHQKVKRLPSKDNWTTVNKIDEGKFDWSWHPDATSPAYIYRFPTQWALSGGPVYTVEGATEVKYVEDQTAHALPCRDNWSYDPKLVDEDAFDYSWHPYVEDEPYIYQFGTQWQKTGGHKYMTPGVHEGSPTKYIDIRILKSKRLPNPNAKEWGVLNNYKIKDFDWSWHHDETEAPFIYVFGNKFYPAEEMPTVEYRISGATEIKYVHDIVAQLAEDKEGWEIPDYVDVKDFDFSWRPSPLDDQPYIYQFGTQWQKTGGPRYIVPGATELKKYIEEPKAKRLPSRTNWEIPKGIDVADFDFSWHPDETEPVPYIYQFGTQWALSGGPRYVVSGAEEVKYVECLSAKALPKKGNWEIPSDIDKDTFDFSWHPYSEDGAFIYQFGTQWQKTGGPKYIVPGATEINYVDTRVLKATKLARKKDPNWTVLNDAEIQSFDWSWHPDETDEPYIYVFGNQHHSAEEFPTIEYRVPGATETKYMKDIVATLAQSRTNWNYTPACDITTFDFSWRPSPLAPLYIYQFGTIADQEDGPKYVVPGATELAYRKRVERKDDDINVPQYYIETTLEDLVREHPNEVFWAMRKNINYENFDFDWRPSIEQARYVQVFGSPDSEATQTYFVSGKTYFSGHRSLNFIEETTGIDEKTLSQIFVKPDMFYVDRGNKEAQARFDAIKQRYPNIQKTRYLNSWVDTVNRCINRSTVDLLWVLNSELDYSEFDFDYYPNPWQLKMITIFGTQWSHWGTTYLVNRETFSEDTKYIKIIEHLSNLNFVKHIRAKATECVYDIVVVDHGNKETEAVVKQLQTKALRQNVSIIKHSGNYVQDMKQIVGSLPNKKEHYIWVASSICDYSDFDFSYICDPFARDNLHVFPSDKQKFGDTFFMDVNKTRELLESMKTLEDYEKVNYNQTLRAKRLRAPVIVVENDTHIEAVKDITDFPYAVLVSETDKDIQVVDEEPMSLWSEESKNIIVTSTGGTRIIAPKEAATVKQELYEYPYIKTANRLALSHPMDIVFLSNGETGAEENWEHLQRITKGLPNRVVRVDGVNGRVQAYHAAVEASTTPWAFTVFAKLKVSPKFDFNWQPDRMQKPKHYIFQAKNPVNGLIYGHQAMIAYNKKLTLDNYGYGLDFTLDDEHASVELLSGTAMYNTDAFSTWRTAFREVIKLLCDDSPISKERLEVWLNKADPDQPFFQESIKGGLDAEEYFHEVNGDFEKLRLSYEWEWLKERYEEVSY